MNFNATASEKHRITLSWDDPAYPTYSTIDQFNSHLVNDLDIVVKSPSGQLYYPWNIDGNCIYDHGLPRKFYKNGVEPIQANWIQECQNKKAPNHIDNNEVIDLNINETGNWTVEISGKGIHVPQSLMATSAQDYSLISSIQLNGPTITHGNELTAANNQSILEFDVPSSIYGPSNTDWAFTSNSSGDLELSITPGTQTYIPFNMNGELTEPLISAGTLTGSDLQTTLPLPLLDQIQVLKHIWEISNTF